MKALNNHGHATILFYDGDCGFCNYAVQFVLRHERHKELRFAALQSPYASTLFQQHDISCDFSTIIVYHQDQFYKKSKAVLLLAKFLHQPYTLLGKLGNILPASFADWLYSFVANRRNRIVQTPSCSIPSTEDKKRFLS